MADGKPGRGSDQFPLRFPDGMRDRLKAEADRNGRSMNAEIVKRLEWTLEVNQDLQQVSRLVGGPEAPESLEDYGIANRVYQSDPELDEVSRALEQATRKAIDETLKILEQKGLIGRQPAPSEPDK